LRRGAWRLAAALAATLGAATPATSRDAIALRFDDLVDRAARIVHGTVRSVDPGRDGEGIPATWVTLDVDETLKGPAAPTITFKQVGVPDPLPDGTLLRLPGLPRYAVGEEVVVFLHGTSRKGFSSPVGLGQGLFRAEPGPKGRAVRAAIATGASEGGSKDVASEDLSDFLTRVRRRARP
jgi:hypothetical protein